MANEQHEQLHKQLKDRTTSQKKTHRKVETMKTNWPPQHATQTVESFA